jgi:hypothetical protein
MIRKYSLKQSEGKPEKLIVSGDDQEVFTGAVRVKSRVAGRCSLSLQAIIKRYSLEQSE